MGRAFNTLCCVQHRRFVKLLLWRIPFRGIMVDPVHATYGGVGPIIGLLQTLQ